MPLLPAIVVEPDDAIRVPADTFCRAFFAYRLTGVAPGRAQRIDPLLLLTRLPAQGAPPGHSRALELRYVAVPDVGEEGLPAAMTCYLVARVTTWATEPTTIRPAAIAFARDLALLLRHALPGHQFTPLADPAELAAARDPFPIADTGEVRRWGDSEPAADGEMGGLLPWLGLPHVDALIEMLLLQPTPTLLAICAAPVAEQRRFPLEPAGLAGPAPAAWARVPAGEEAIARNAGQHTEIAAWAGSSWTALHETALRQASVQLRIQLAGAAPLGAALINTVLGEVGGPGALTAPAVLQDPTLPLARGAVWVRPRTARRPGLTESEVSVALRNLQQLAFAPWCEPAEHGLVAGYLADLGEAARLFALPETAPWLPQYGTILELPAPAPDGPGLRLGVNRARLSTHPVILPLAGRQHHIWIVGHTGTGKSTTLLSLIHQDIQAGRGVIVLDPHGDLVAQTLERIPPGRRDDVILFDPGDTNCPVGFNPLEASSEAEQAQVVSAFIGLLGKLYDPHQQGIVGPRFEHATRNGLLTVMSRPGSTLVELVRVMTDETFLQALLPEVQDPIVRRYWTDQIANTSDFHRSEVLDWIVSKFGRFVTDPTIRRIIGQSRSSFSFRAAMDSGKIVLLSLAKGRVGSENANFLGLVLLPRILQAALARVDVPPAARTPITLYIDEFQNYATDAIAHMLAEARKYGLALTLANQHVGQLTSEVRDAVLGNAGTILSFRLGVMDALLMEQLLAPSPVTAADLTALPNYAAYGRMLLAGQRSPAFTLHTEPIDEPADPDGAALIRRRCRAAYGRPKSAVDTEINRRAHLA